MARRDPRRVLTVPHPHQLLILPRDRNHEASNPNRQSSRSGSLSPHVDLSAHLNKHLVQTNVLRDRVVLFWKSSCPVLGMRDLPVERRDLVLLSWQVMQRNVAAPHSEHRPSPFSFLRHVSEDSQ